MLTTVETTGTINGENRIVLDENLPVSESSRVRVIVFFEENNNNDADEKDWMSSAASNEAFDFLADESEDIYTLADGKPL